MVDGWTPPYDDDVPVWIGRELCMICSARVLHALFALGMLPYLIQTAIVNLSYTCTEPTFGSSSQ